MKTETINPAPLSIADALSLSLGIKPSELPARYASRCPSLMEAIETLRGKIPNRIAKWEASIAPAAPVETLEAPAVSLEMETAPSFRGSYVIPHDITPLHSLVGQSHIKENLETVTLSILNGGKLPVMGLFGDPGSGKTAIVQAWGNDLEKRTGGKVVSRFVNCKAAGNISDPEFIVLMQELNDALLGIGPAMVLILDEFATTETVKAGSAYPKFAAIASVIGGNKNGGGILTPYKCDPVPFNPHRLGLVIATWDTGKAAADVKTRFEEQGDNVTAPYEHGELVAILEILLRREARKQGTKITWTAPALALLARAFRGNARKAEDCAVSLGIRGKAHGGIHITKINALEVMRVKKYRPYGMTDADIKVLRSLDYGPMTEAKIVSILGDNPKKPLKLQYLASEFQTRDHDDNILDSGPLVRLVKAGKYARHPFADKVIALLENGKWT